MTAPTTGSLKLTGDLAVIRLADRERIAIGHVTVAAVSLLLQDETGFTGIGRRRIDRSVGNRGVVDVFDGRVQLGLYGGDLQIIGFG
jgi:hypothetical protein